MLRRLFLLLLLSLASLQRASALWVRIAIDRTGLYALHPEQLRAWGFSEPDKVAVFGSGGAMLPEDLRQLLQTKLLQTPTYQTGGVRYFFAQGTTRWEYLPALDFFSHETNPYSQRAYYLLTDEASPEVMEEVALSPPPAPLPSEAATYTALYLHEEDRFTPSSSGRHLFGEDLSLRPSLSLPLPSLSATSARLRLAYMAYPKSEAAQLQLTLGNQPILTSSITVEEMLERMPAGSYHVYGRRKLTAPSRPVALPLGALPPLTLSYSSPQVQARLDYVEGNFTTPLHYTGTDQLLFTRASKARQQSFDLNAPKDSHLFRIDPGLAPQHLTGSRRFTVTSTEQPPRFLALRLSQAYSPTYVRTEKGAPLRLEEAPAVDLFIISTEELLSEAERLANYYRSEGKQVFVASQQELFNALQGGTPDASIYRLACYKLYQRAREGGRAEHFQLLLFGDGAQDNRRLSEAWQALPLKDKELLLTYQSRNSLDLESYTSDDYFTMLSPEEDKATPLDSDADHLQGLSMTIGVGRFPVRSLEEARALVDKTIRYSQGKDLGIWRSRATFIADNGDANRHLQQSLAVSSALSAVAPRLFLQPVYLADYPRVTQGGQVTVPGAKRALQKALQDGTLLVTYTGHGGPRSWTDEQLLTSADIRRFSHQHLPLWLTATCDFAPFDAPTTSAGEEVILHPTSGGVALLGTTRIAWDLPNQALATAVLEALFTPDSRGLLRPLGTAIRDAKNKLRRGAYPINRLNFTLLGSPLLQLPLPQDRISLDEVDTPSRSTHSRLTLTPGASLQISGEVRDEAGHLDPNFSGRIRLRLYDRAQSYQTIDNFNYSNRDIPPVHYTAHKDLLLDEEVAITAGRYSLSTPLPYAVSASSSPLRLEAYAYDTDRGRDAFSTFTEIYWGKATDQPAPPSAPIQIIDLALGGEHSFPQLGQISPGARLEALIQAPQGIQRGSHILGHQPLLLIDDQESLTFDLSEHLQRIEGTRDHYRLSFPLPALSPGAHRLHLRLWSPTGELTEAVANFSLTPNLSPTISQAKLYPSLVHSGQALTLEVSSPALSSPQELLAELFDLTGKCLVRLPLGQRSYSLGQEAFDLSALTSQLPAGSYLLRLRLQAGGRVSPETVVRFQLLP